MTPCLTSWIKLLIQAHFCVAVCSKNIDLKKIQSHENISIFTKFTIENVKIFIGKIWNALLAFMKVYSMLQCWFKVHQSRFIKFSRNSISLNIANQIAQWTCLPRIFLNAAPDVFSEFYCSLLVRSVMSGDMFRKNTEQSKYCSSSVIKFVVKAFTKNVSLVTNKLQLKWGQ
jgi:hypothetical protein